MRRPVSTIMSAAWAGNTCGQQRARVARGETSEEKEGLLRKSKRKRLTGNTNPHPSRFD